MPKSRGVWIFAVVGIAAIAILLAIYLLRTGITARTSLSSNDNLQALYIPGQDLEITARDQPGSSGDNYLAAISDWDSQSSACEKFAQNPMDNPPRPMALVLLASKQNFVSVFSPNPSAIINYDAEHPALNDLQELGHDMCKAALSMHMHKNADEAIVLFQSVYEMGRDLVVERLNYDEYLKGMGLMDEAAQGLIECEPADSPSRDILASGIKDRVSYDAAHVEPIYKMLSSADAETISSSAGDVFAFATEGQERVFRVEATLKLGRYRFDATNSADQTAAGKTLDKLAQDPDAFVHCAATAAKNLTLEQFRTIH